MSEINSKTLESAKLSKARQRAPFLDVGFLGIRVL